MSINKVKEYFKKYGIEDKILEFNESSATVLEAAHALNCEPVRIAKSLSFDLNNETILVIVAGNMKIDNHKFKETFNCKAKMLAPDITEEKIGHAPGGVCPFAINDNVKVYLDESLKQCQTVFPACGSSNSAIELTIEELEKYSNYEKWVDVCKIIESN